MTNKGYIKISMHPTISSMGGAFDTEASFQLDNINTPFTNVKVRIDIGCSVSVITLARFIRDRKILTKLKAYDIQNNARYITSYGVETGNNRPSDPKTYQEKMDSPALKFEHNVRDFSINGVRINKSTLHVNYDRTGTILIGMDILKDWDIHIGTIDNYSLSENGQTIFLGCPRDNINQECLLELERLFDIGTAINYALINGKINNKEP